MIIVREDNEFSSSYCAWFGRFFQRVFHLSSLPENIYRNKLIKRRGAYFSLAYLSATLIRGRRLLKK